MESLELIGTLNLFIETVGIKHMVNSLYEILKKLRRVLEASQLSNYTVKIEAAHSIKLLADRLNDVADIAVQCYDKDVSKALAAAECDRVPKVQLAAHEARKAWNVLKDKSLFAGPAGPAGPAEPAKSSPWKALRERLGFSAERKAEKQTTKLAVMRQLAKLKKSNKEVQGGDMEKSKEIISRWKSALYAGKYLKRGMGLGGGFVPLAESKAGAKKKERPSIKEVIAKMKAEKKSKLDNFELDKFGVQKRKDQEGNVKSMQDLVHRAKDAFIKKENAESIKDVLNEQKSEKKALPHIDEEIKENKKEGKEQINEIVTPALEKHEQVSVDNVKTDVQHALNAPTESFEPQDEIKESAKPQENINTHNEVSEMPKEKATEASKNEGELVKESQPKANAPKAKSNWPNFVIEEAVDDNAVSCAPPARRSRWEEIAKDEPTNKEQPVIHNAEPENADNHDNKQKENIEEEVKEENNARENEVVEENAVHKELRREEPQEDFSNKPNGEDSKESIENKIEATEKPIEDAIINQITKEEAINSNEDISSHESDRKANEASIENNEQKIDEVQQATDEPAEVEEPIDIDKESDNEDSAKVKEDNEVHADSEHKGEALVQPDENLSIKDEEINDLHKEEAIVNYTTSKEENAKEHASDLIDKKEVIANYTENKEEIAKGDANIPINADECNTAEEAVIEQQHEEQDNIKATEEQKDIQIAEDQPLDNTISGIVDARQEILKTAHKLSEAKAITDPPEEQKEIPIQFKGKNNGAAVYARPQVDGQRIMNPNNAQLYFAPLPTIPSSDIREEEYDDRTLRADTELSLTLPNTTCEQDATTIAPHEYLRTAKEAQAGNAEAAIRAMLASGNCAIKCRGRLVPAKTLVPTGYEGV